MSQMHSRHQAQEGTFARERQEQIAALASERRAPLERTHPGDALAFPSADELHEAMLAGRRDP
jgi:hypothetical protein